MVVYNFNFVGVSGHPFETNSPLLVDSDAMLPFPVALQGFQCVSRRNPEIFEPNCGIQELQFMQGLLLDVAWQSPGELGLPNFLGFTTFEISDQPLLFYIHGYNRQEGRPGVLSLAARGTF
jgi:hypothetical protein